jgi:RNA polymerase sigma-70 factor (ECF subfamily)
MRGVGLGDGGADRGQDEGERVDGPDSDGALLAAAIDGDAKASRLLVDRHLGRVVAFAQRLVGNRADAEDVAQDVFLALWRSGGRWQAGGGATLGTWLLRVAYNRAVDRLRRRPAVPIDLLPDLPDGGPGPEARLQGDAVARRVAARLAALPERQRAAILLSHFEDLGNAEIGAVLGVGVEAVESLLARGRRTLRSVLRDERDDLLGEP